MERMETNFERQLTMHEKEMLMLGERCHKLDFQLQTALKEKSGIVSSSAAKDKEIDELKKRLDAMRSKVCLSGICRITNTVDGKTREIIFSSQGKDCPL